MTEIQPYVITLKATPAALLASGSPLDCTFNPTKKESASEDVNEKSE